MQLNLIELDIQDRENSLKRCKANLQYLHSTSDGKKHPEVISMTEYEIFYLKDQLAKFYIVAGILKEEYGSRDEVLLRI